MKANNILKVCGLMLTGALVLTACSDDDHYDFTGSGENKVFFDPTAETVQTSNVYNTPAGLFGIVGGTFKVKAQYATDATIHVGAVADTSLVAAFNQEHAEADGHVYNSLPTEALNALTVTEATIKPGTNVGDTTLIVQVPTEACGGLTEEYYVVPLRLNVDSYQGGTSGYSGGVSTDHGVAYAIIHNAGSQYISARSQTVNCGIVNTPVGTFGSVSAEFSYGVAVNPNNVFTIKAEVDNSLIAAYNQEHGTNYVQAPANVLNQLQITDGTIPAGETETNPGIKVSCPDAAAQQITQSCLIPLKVTFYYPNGQTTELPADYLAIDSKTSFINDDAASFAGTAGDGVADGWKAINCTNLNPDELSMILSGSQWSRQWRLQDENEPSCEFTIDLGSVKKLAGFYVGSEALANADVFVSTDNKTWTELGDTKDHRAKSEYNYETWSYTQEYVLYGSINCRYFRAKCTFSTDGWAWRWYKYLESLSLFFE